MWTFHASYRRVITINKIARKDLSEEGVIMMGMSPINIGFKSPQILKINTQIGKTNENEKSEDNSQVSKGNFLPSPPGDPIPDPGGGLKRLPPWPPRPPKPGPQPKDDPKKPGPLGPFFPDPTGPKDYPRDYKPGDPIIFGDSWKKHTPRPGTWYYDNQWLRWGDRIY